MSIISCYHNISKPITHYTIFGERHSGTNFLERAIFVNLKIDVTWECGFKHWIGNNDFSLLNKSGHILFIGVVRNIYDWIGGMSEIPHNLILPTPSSPEEIIHHSPFCSFEFNRKKKIYSKIPDINYIKLTDYKNIFENRYYKNIFLYHYMPFLVNNYILFTYEQFINNDEQIFNIISSTFKIQKKLTEYTLANDDKTQKNRKKKPRVLPKNVISYINDHAKWEAEYIFGYEKRLIEDS